MFKKMNQQVKTIECKLNTIKVQDWISYNQTNNYQGIIKQWIHLPLQKYSKQNVCVYHALGSYELNTVFEN